mmetsp:Transcript_78426/g.196972  ORF Transcript_78426/g.196972 Transcript_78426/m.196972 type:complete len:354 (-) Transcript_78426:129-1190(-)
MERKKPAPLMDTAVFQSAPPVLVQETAAEEDEEEDAEDQDRVPVRNTFIDFSEQRHQQVVQPISAPGKFIGRLSGQEHLFSMPATPIAPTPCSAGEAPMSRTASWFVTRVAPGAVLPGGLSPQLTAAPPQQPPRLLVQNDVSTHNPPMLSPHLPPEFDAGRMRGIPPPPLASPAAFKASTSPPAHVALVAAPPVAPAAVAPAVVPAAIPTAVATPAQAPATAPGTVTATAAPRVTSNSPTTVLASQPPGGAQFVPSPVRAPLLLPMGQPLAQGSLIEVTPVVQAQSPPRFAPPSYVLPTMSPTNAHGSVAAPPPMHTPGILTPGAAAAGQPRCFPAVAQAGGEPPAAWPSTPF